MFRSFFATLALGALLVSAAPRNGRGRSRPGPSTVDVTQPIAIQTPSTGLSVCDPATFSWDASELAYPVYLRISTYSPDPSSRQGGLIAQPEEEEAVITKADRATWLVDYLAGTTVSIALRDSIGRVGTTDPLTIAHGHSTSCLGDFEFDEAYNSE